MNKTVKYILASLTAIAAVVYFLFAFVFVENKKKSTVCNNINIEITNGESHQFIEKEDIEKMLLQGGISIIGKCLDSINIFELEQHLNKNNAIKTANIFTTIDGSLNVKIEQRCPIVRVQCENASFYIDESGYMFPISAKTNLQIPIVTGRLKSTPNKGFVGYIPDDESEIFLKQLYEFALFLNKDKFWNNMIEQININNDKIEIIPQIAQHVVKFGTLDSFKSKLNKLKTFYSDAMPSIGWNKYKTISIEYKNQIVCKK